MQSIHKNSQNLESRSGGQPERHAPANLKGFESVSPVLQCTSAQAGTERPTCCAICVELLADLAVCLEGLAGLGSCSLSCAHASTGLSTWFERAMQALGSGTHWSPDAEGPDPAMAQCTGPSKTCTRLAPGVHLGSQGRELSPQAEGAVKTCPCVFLSHGTHPAGCCAIHPQASQQGLHVRQPKLFSCTTSMPLLAPMKQLRLAHIVIFLIKYAAGATIDTGDSVQNLWCLIMSLALSRLMIVLYVIAIISPSKCNHEDSNLGRSNGESSSRPMQGI